MRTAQKPASSLGSHPARRGAPQQPTGLRTGSPAPAALPSPVHWSRGKRGSFPDGPPAGRGLGFLPPTLQLPARRRVAEEPAPCPQQPPALACVTLDGEETGQDRRRPGDRWTLTDQDEDAHQQRDEGARAQRC